MTKSANRISLDRSKLLGFKLDAATSKKSGSVPAAKLGAKIGGKIGGKVGTKPAR